MKKTLGLALVGGLMALGVGQSLAQSNTVSLQTLNIALTGFTSGTNQSGAATADKIDTKRVISSLVGSNSTKSKLQFTVNTDGSTSFFVTSGTGKNVTAIDVTPFFTFGTLAGPLTKGKTSYTIDSFGFGGGTDTNGVSLTPISFTVQGFSTIQGSGAFSSSVNGSGSDNGGLALLKGTISATAPKSLTITISGGGSSTNNPSTNAVAITP